MGQNAKILIGKGNAGSNVIPPVKIVGQLWPTKKG